MTTMSGPQRGGGPRVGPVAIGLIAFALVFLLIIGGTTAFLVVRSVTSGRDGGGTASTETTNPSTDTAASTDDEHSPTEKAEFCWVNDAEGRESTNAGGAVRGGNVQFTVPKGYSTSVPMSMPFSDDSDGVAMEVDTNWVALIGAGRVVWQTGYEYPGDKKAAERLLDCRLNDSAVYGSRVSQRHIEDQKIEAVTVDGVSGYRASGTVVFDKTSLTKTTGSTFVFIVLDTKGGPSYFYAEGALGVDESITAAADAEKSLAVV